MRSSRDAGVSAEVQLRLRWKGLAPASAATRRELSRPAATFGVQAAKRASARHSTPLAERFRG